MQRPTRNNLRNCLIFAVVLLGFALLVSPIDGWLARNVQHHRLPGELRRIVTWSEIFAHGFGVAVILLGIFLLAPHLRRYMPRLIACPLFAGLAATGLKYFFERTRPMAMYHLLDTTTGQWTVGWNQELAGRIGKIGYNFQSFPSGHAATAFGLAVGLSWLLPKGRWFFFSLAILAASQRSISLAHWNSDVFVGAAVGVSVAGIVTGTRFSDQFYSWFERDKESKHPLISIEEKGERAERIAA